MSIERQPKIAKSTLAECLELRTQLKTIAEERDALRAENEALGKVYRSNCPECGYTGCVRGKKACDTEIDALRAALEEIAADGCDCLDKEEGGPWRCHGCIAKRVL